MFAVLKHCVRNLQNLPDFVKQPEYNFIEVLLCVDLHCDPETDKWKGKDKSFTENS